MINNYCKQNKLKYFISGEVNYIMMPIDCRTNNSLENYNRIMKQSLGKRKYVNWINFESFLKNESVCIRHKIINNSNQNILYNAK